jgi:hypothetical protein
LQAKTDYCKSYLRTPASVPCCQVFEPLGSSGCSLVSLGFSVLAEHAHQNQRELPFMSMLGQRASYNHEHGRGPIQTS